MNTAQTDFIKVAKNPVKRVRSIGGHLCIVIDPQLAYKFGIDDESKIEESITAGGILLRVAKGAGV